MLPKARNRIGFVLGALVFYGDVRAAFTLALLHSALGSRVSWALAATSAAGAAVAVLFFVRGVPRSRPLKKRLEEWAERLDDWIAPPPVRPPGATKPVDHLAFLLDPATAPPLPAPATRSTEPRPLAEHDLATWKCPTCQQTPVAGTHAWDDRGPFQLLSNHAFTCPDGHRWTNSTDGG
ncbi:hypothetical protein E4N62_24920 [Streptomyces sp. MNU76]|uniref:hypothetical protein n=1 Tax=Streptomyces sp. MNU76 TaxID=2560026 RepID=UPI001E4245B8|nr:hypothetical protein [Streptomyces sp. MNU76]MCC9708215.1 hypothetical protein [Streptomyces sp. MNU76]